MDSGPYDAVMAVPSTVDPLVREALQACRLFAGLDDAGIALCASALRVRKFRRGEVTLESGGRRAAS